jgi:baseplate J-like protein
VPLTIPNLDDRRYQELLDEALARVPVYTPEWTNFNKSDPGVTLIEIFAFMTENLLYRANQVPERNRKKFLKLLNVPLQPATSARGLATITNEKGLLQTFTFNDGVEMRSGKVPFRTTRPLDVLPVEGRIYFKQSVAASPQVMDYYQQLYASFRGSPKDPPPKLYQAAAFPLPGGDPVDLSQTVDGYLWLALFVRQGDKPAQADAARDAIAGKTLTVGVVPFLENNTAVLPSGRAVSAPSSVTLEFDIPSIPASGGLVDSQNREPQFRPLPSNPSTDVFAQPGVVDVILPDKNSLYLWNNIDPLESGVGKLPPSLEDTSLNDRLITWLRIRPSATTPAQFKWIGINCVPISQRERISAEILPDGTGEPDQIVKLSHAPVLSKTVTVSVTTRGVQQTWTEVEDIFLAGAEVPVPDLRLPPGSPVPPFDPAKARVFVLDPEAGQITFGDGAHGGRPPEGATMRASYDFSQGAAGNVGPDSINQAPALPDGFKVDNPVRTWGGADAETPAEGEKQIARYLQHRDRLVTAYDFEVVTLRTPGVEIGRVEVLPNFHPELSSRRGGDAAGAVTLMLIPTFDPVTPDAPSPSNDFLETVCGYLDNRRLVTTEVYLRGPEYVGIWISIGIQPLPGMNSAPVREAVKAAVLEFLAPIVGGPQQLPSDPATLLTAPQSAPVYKGWPMGKPVISLEIMAVAGRTPGVEFVQEVLLAQSAAAVPQVEITGLQLPRVLGISVTIGPALSLDELRGGTTQAAATPGAAQLPVIPGECH